MGEVSREYVGGEQQRLSRRITSRVYRVYRYSPLETPHLPDILKHRRREYIYGIRIRAVLARLLWDETTCEMVYTYLGRPSYISAVDIQCLSSRWLLSCVTHHRTFRSYTGGLESGGEREICLY